MIYEAGFHSTNIGFRFFESGRIVLYLTLTIRPLDTARVPGSLEARIYKPATRVVLPPHLLPLHVHSTPKENINPFTAMGIRCKPIVSKNLKQITTKSTLE